MTIKSICQNCQKPKAFIKDNYKTLSIAIALILSVGLIVGYTCGFSLGLWGAVGTTALFLIITSMRYHYPKKKQSSSPKSQPLNNKKKSIPSSSKTSSTAPSSIETPPSSSSAPISRNPQTPSSSSFSPPEGYAGGYGYGMYAGGGYDPLPLPSSLPSLPISPTDPLVVPKSDIVITFNGRNKTTYYGISHADYAWEHAYKWRAANETIVPRYVPDEELLINGHPIDPGMKIGDLPKNANKEKIIDISVPREKKAKPLAFRY